MRLAGGITFPSYLSRELNPHKLSVDFNWVCLRPCLLTGDLISAGGRFCVRKERKLEPGVGEKGSK